MKYEEDKMICEGLLIWEDEQACPMRTLCAHYSEEVIPRKKFDVENCYKNGAPTNFTINQEELLYDTTRETDGRRRETDK
jgi:hypothetical protein